MGKVQRNAKNRYDLYFCLDSTSTLQMMLVCLAIPKRTRKKKTEKVDSEGDKFWLKIDHNKLMIMRIKKLRIKYKELEEIETFNYLGSVTNKNSDIRERLTSGLAKQHQLSKDLNLWKSRKMSRKIDQAVQKH